MSFEERLQMLEARLARLEHHLKSKPADVYSAGHSNIVPPSKSVKELKSANWLGFLAIICFVLAGGFIVKLSVNSGWLTPARQINLAYLFGSTLIVSGFLIMKRDKAYASMLPAAGIIILYLTTFGAYRLYSLISLPSTLMVIVIISGICSSLYIKLKHAIYAIVASIGTYSAPILLNLNTNTTFSLYYFLICSATFALMSIRFRSRFLMLVSAYFAILVTGLVGLNLEQDKLVAFVLSVQFLIFVLSTYFYSIKFKEPLTSHQCWLLMPLLIIFYAIDYFYVHKAYPNLAPWIFMAFAFSLIAFYQSIKNKLNQQFLPSQSIVFALITLILFHAFYFEILSLDLRPWLAIFIMLILAFTPAQFTKSPNDSITYIPIVAIFTILLMEYVSVITHLINQPTPYWIFVALSSFLSFWLVIIRQLSNSCQQKQFSLLFLIAVHVLGMLALYQWFTNSLAVSISWLIYAIGVIGYAYFYRDQIIAKSALVILSIAAGKALLYDAASTPTMIRILCLLLTGGVLYSCGYMLKKITSWK